MMKLVLSEEISDLGVWQAVLAGDQYAFEVLFRRCYDDLYTGAVTYSGNPDLAADHIQELFMKIWRCREKLERVENVRTYLWTALRRSIIDSFRKNKIEKKDYDQWNSFNCQIQYPVEELVIHDELGAVPSNELTGSVNQLTPRQRESLYLKFYEPFPDPSVENAWNRLKYKLDHDNSYKKASANNKTSKGFFQWILRVVTLFLLSF